MEKDIPYFAINVPNDTCLECGFTGEFNDECPMCGSHNIEQLRRAPGILQAIIQRHLIRVNRKKRERE